MIHIKHLMEDSWLQVLSSPSFIRTLLKVCFCWNCFVKLKFVTHVSQLDVQTFEVVHNYCMVPIGHFTGVCLVTWPLTESEAGVDFALIQTSLLFLCKCKLVSIKNNLINTTKMERSVSEQGHLQPCCYSKARSLNRQLENGLLTITAEIHERSLANFYCQHADRHMNLKFMRHVSEQELAI